MVDVNDPSNLDGRLRNEQKRLESADIDDRDRNVIGEFVKRRRGVEDKSRNTCTIDMAHLRRASDRADVPLVDMRKPEVDAFLATLATPKDEGGWGIGLDSSSMYQYRRTLRLFFDHLDTHPDYDDYGWWEDIELPKMEVRGSKDRDQMLTGEEIEALKDGAENRPRDRALVALLGDIGGRITLTLSLRVADMHLEGDEPYITPNFDVVDGLKDIDSEQIPILHCRSELRSWLNTYHPDGENPDVPLFPIDKGYDPENPQACALSSSRARSVLKECAARAGVDKPVDPHNFRRTAATRLSNTERLKPQEIRQITGWSEKAYHEMLNAYDYTSDAERNSNIHQAMGFSSGSSTQVEGDLAMVSIVCGTCRNTHTSLYCPRCGAPRDEDARQRQRELDEEHFESGTVAEDAETTEDVRDGRELSESSPAIRRIMAEDDG